MKRPPQDVLLAWLEYLHEDAVTARWTEMAGELTALISYTLVPPRPTPAPSSASDPWRDS